MSTGKTHEGRGTNAADVQRTPVKRRRRWLRRAGVALLALLVILIGLRAYLHLDAARAVRQYRAAGHPTTWAEFVERYGPADGEPSTGADFFAALALYVEPTPEQKPHVPFLGDVNLEWPPLGEPVPDEMRRAVTEFLAANAPMLAALEAAHRGGHLMLVDVYRDDRDVNDWLLLDGLGPLRRIASLRDQQFQLALHDGRVDDAINAIAATRRLADASYAQPLLITELVGISIATLSAAQSKALLGHTRLASPQLEALGSLFAAVSQSSPGITISSLQGDMVFDLALRKQASRGTVGIMHAVSGTSDLGTALYVRNMMRYIDAAAEPNPRDRIRAMVEADQAAARPQWFCTVVGSCAPSVATTRVLVQHEMQLHALQVAVAVERFQRDRHNLPATLTELVPAYLNEVPDDLFSDGPLRYIRLDDGYVIYSVGFDGVDGGGQVDGEWNDIGIRVQRADLRAER